MKRIPFIVGNWKMYKDAGAAVQFCGDFRDAIRIAGDREVGLAPAFPIIPIVREKLDHSRIRVGAQNTHSQKEGAYTGEISAEMLVSVGCDFVIVGHSERRQHFKETDSMIGEKIQAACRANLDPIFCLGETLQEREAGSTEEVIRRQLQGGLASLTHLMLNRIIIAYEPVWAIGTGKTATPETAEEVHEFIREYFMVQYGIEIGNRLRILYGGSVKPDNIDALMAKPDIDGALVGGASLKVEDFARIVNYQV